MGLMPRQSRPAADLASRSLPLLRGLFLVLSSFVALSLLLAVAVTSRAEVEREAEGADFPDLFRLIDRHLQRSYLDLERIQPGPLVERALSSLELAADEIYVEDDPLDALVAMHVAENTKVFSLQQVKTRQDSVNLLEAIFNFLSLHYRGSASLNDLRYAAANGYLSGIDPHTLVFPPENFEDFETHIKGEISGVGMMVGATEDGRLQVKQVLKETPAFAAGFKKDDLITKIDDESTINMTITEAVQKIRGPTGSEVVLTIRRRSAKDKAVMETLVVPVVRQRVRIKSVESKLIENWDPDGKSPWKGGVGYVKVINFDQLTTPSLEENLTRLRVENKGPLAGLILDLRGNSGGLLTQAILMSDLFLKQGDIVITAKKDDFLMRTRAGDDGYEPEYPIVMLADEGSASGAEIVLGALQKNDRALILGGRTFGKGSVQQLQGLKHGAQLKITVSEYLIPGNISIQETGVVPDIFAQEVSITDEATNVFPVDNYLKEMDYETHIVSKYKKEEEPTYRVKYFHTPAEDESTPSERFIAGELEPERDPLVQMALRVLALAEIPFQPRALLNKNTEAFDRLEKEFFAEIVAELGRQGTNWEADGPPGEIAPGEFDLKIERRFIQEPSEDAEDPVPLNFLVVDAKATNRGPRPLYRIKAIAESDYHVFKGFEILFGKIDPGQTIQRSHKIRLPYFTRAQSSDITLEVSGDDGKVFHTAGIEIILPSKERPSFAYQAELRGSDGELLEKIREDSDVSMKLTIFNTGKGIAHKGVAILRNKTGRQIFLEAGRIEFTDLAPGQQSEVEFQFKVRDGEPVETYRFDLVIYDSYSGESLTRELQILAEDARGLGFPNGQRFEPPSIVLKLVDPDSSEALLLTDRDELRLEGLVSSRTQDFKVWITNLAVGTQLQNPDKIYFMGSGGSDRLEVKTPVRLSEGLNIITLAAKDQHGIESRQSWVVRRKPSGSSGALEAAR
ncbi:MAG: PDZ domain-containing protein [Planctomycetes bacterium]|nr:PDZ domain-containing protein [Planctomycetota bacterium]